MNKRQRKQYIIDTSVKNKRTLNDLAKELGCSSRTIQRDIYEISNIDKSAIIVIKNKYVVCELKSGISNEFSENDKIELLILLSNKSISKSEISRTLFIPTKTVNDFFQSIYNKFNVDIELIPNRTKRMRIYTILSQYDQQEFDSEFLKSLKFLNDSTRLKRINIDNVVDRSLYSLIYELNPTLFYKEILFGNELRHNDFYNHFDDEIVNRVSYILKNSIKLFYKQEGYIFDYKEKDLESICRHISSVVDNYLSLGIRQYRIMDNHVFTFNIDNYYQSKLTEIITQSLNSEFGIKINTEDSTYIYIHFSILMKSKTNIRACLVDKYDNKISQYISEELKHQFTELSTIDIYDYNYYKENQETIDRKYDIHFTTYRHLNKDNFIIFDILDVNENLIMRKISASLQFTNIEKKVIYDNNSETYQQLLSNVFESEIRHNYAEESLLQLINMREKLFPTKIHKFAFPHGEPECIVANKVIVVIPTNPQIMQNEDLKCVIWLVLTKDYIKSNTFRIENFFKKFNKVEFQNDLIDNDFINILDKI